MTIWQLVILVLSILVIGLLVMTTFVSIDKESESVIGAFDNVICVIFIVDFFGRLVKAPNKWRFVMINWIDLLASIPTIEALRIGRLARVFRLLRVLRALRSMKYVVAFIFSNRAKGAFASVALTSFLVWFFAALMILHVENDPNSTIRSAEDALWWSITTITTVGYGDLYPVTTEGRIIAALLMVVGIGLYGTLTAYIASMFVGADNEVRDEVRALREEIAAIRAIVTPNAQNETSARREKLSDHFIDP